MGKKEKVLTKELVEKLGLDKLSVITSDMLKGYTSIEDWAFFGCGNLFSVTIPNSVTSIGERAFFGCVSLVSIEIPNSVTSIGDSAFRYCVSLASITIPNSVTNIGDYAFGFCSSLTSVTIPNSVTSIGERAFFGCSGLISVIILNGVASIGNSAFCGCSSLASVTFPNSVTSIGSCAFYECNNLISVTIADRVYKKQTITNGKCKSYKGFNDDMTCRGFQYEEGKTYEIKGNPILCKQGFHACLNLTDVFTYYWGEFGSDIVVHEVELEGVSTEKDVNSKVAAKKITIGKRIL